MFQDLNQKYLKLQENPDLLEKLQKQLEFEIK